MGSLQEMLKTCELFAAEHNSAQISIRPNAKLNELHSFSKKETLVNLTCVVILFHGLGAVFILETISTTELKV